MRIVVMGAGTVGTSISSLLVLHGHSLTVIDTDPRRVKHLNETLDARAITGSASQSSILFQAGVGSADLVLAVTGDDEVNIVAASMGKAMGAGRAVARVYAPVFRDLSTFDYRQHFGIDRLVSIEQLTALELARHIRHPGSVAVENLAGGNLEVHELVVSPSAKAAGKSLKSLDLPRGVRVGSIARDGKIWIAGADDQVQIGDRLTIIGKRGEVGAVRGQFCKGKTEGLHVVIAGGGETGYHLASSLESAGCKVVLMESELERCEFLAAHLEHTVVVHRDATRSSNLEEERVGSADAFIACTGDDETNIVAAVEAGDIGAKMVMSLVGRPDYAQVVRKLGIDYAVSPREVVAKQVLGFLTTGAVISKSPLSEESSLSILELEVEAGSPATEHVLANLNLPEQCVIAAVVREGFASVPGADDRLQVGDTAVALLADEVQEQTAKVFEN